MYPVLDEQSKQILYRDLGIQRNPHISPDDDNVPESIMYVVPHPVNAVVTCQIEPTVPASYVSQALRLQGITYDPQKFMAVLIPGGPTINYYEGKGALVCTGGRTPAEAYHAINQFLCALINYMPELSQPPAFRQPEDHGPLQNIRQIRIKNMRVENWVACVRTGLVVRLEDLRTLISGSSCDEKFPGLIVRKDGGIANLMFPSGSANITGATDWNQILAEANFIAYNTYLCWKCMEKQHAQHTELLECNQLVDSRTGKLTQSAMRTLGRTEREEGERILSTIDPVRVRQNLMLTSSLIQRLVTWRASSPETSSAGSSPKRSASNLGEITEEKEDEIEGEKRESPSKLHRSASFVPEQEAYVPQSQAEKRALRRSKLYNSSQ